MEAVAYEAGISRCSVLHHFTDENHPDGPQTERDQRSRLGRDDRPCAGEEVSSLKRSETGVPMDRAVSALGAKRSAATSRPALDPPPRRFA